MTELGAAPKTPAASHRMFYAKSDGLYWVNSSGVEKKVVDFADWLLTNIPVDIQIYTNTGANTWNKPTGAHWVDVIMFGAGGGGGSGRKGEANTNRCGGTGGGSGAFTRAKLPALILGSSETVTVGAGGSGGASQTTNNSNGINGSAGGNTTFGTWLRANGGGAGSGGASAQGVGGIAGSGGEWNGLVGGLNPLSTGGDGSSSQSGELGCPFGPGSGAGGGAIDSSNSIYNGGTGGIGSYIQVTPPAGGIAGTTGSGRNAGAGTPVTANNPLGGAGGGGGASSKTTVAGNGGNGGIYGAGGGGGGACLSPTYNSGAGGNGANGIAVVITY